MNKIARTIALLMEPLTSVTIYEIDEIVGSKRVIWAQNSRTTRNSINPRNSNLETFQEYRFKAKSNVQSLIKDPISRKS